MVVEVRRADTEPDVADLDVVAVSGKQLFDQCRALGGFHPDHVLRAAAGECEPEAIDRLEGLFLVDRNGGIPICLLGELQGRSLLGKEGRFIGIGQPVGHLSLFLSLQGKRRERRHGDQRTARESRFHMVSWSAQ
jgi:hypothetical protein